MKPIERLLSLLPGHRVSNGGFRARCPAHEDRTPSLSLKEGDGGKVILHCFAGCSAEAIVASMGMTMHDLFPCQHEESHDLSPTSSPSAWPSADAAISTYGRGEPTTQWAYHAPDGQEVGRVLRWDTPTGKVVRPISLCCDGWSLAGMPSPRPLFHCPALFGTDMATVYVVEGEKCVDAMSALGLLATTSVGGSNAAEKTDWGPLAGRDVVILPDNDKPGDGYAATAAGLLAGIAASVCVVNLDGLPDGGDVADLVRSCQSDAERQALRETIELATSRTKEIPMFQKNANPTSTLTYKPFPVDALPEPASPFVREAAAAVGCDAAFVALPLLTLLGAAVGNSRRLHVKSTYDVPAILWTGIIGDSGTAKSPALATAVSIAYEQEARLQQQPDQRRFVVADSTTEALALMMESNPRGLLCIRDELSGWLGSIDRYTVGKPACSADQAFLLSAYGGRPHTVDRRTGTPRHLHIPRSSLWVTGGIQLGLLANAMGQTQREAGLLARLLLACPPIRQQQYTEDEVSKETKEALTKTVERLMGLEGEESVRLSPAAKRHWIGFHNSTCSEFSDMTGDLRAAWSKLRETALRVGLIFHLTGEEDGEVSEDTMQRAVVLAEWFKHETQRVYTLLTESKSAREQRGAEETLMAWIVGQGEVTERDVERGPRCFRGSNLAGPTLQRLVSKGALVAESRPAGPSGGQPTTFYRLNGATVSLPALEPLATQPSQSQEKQGSVAVATSEGSELWTKL